MVATVLVSIVAAMVVSLLTTLVLWMLLPPELFDLIIVKK